jgi:YidC/Oxa1 family membrane protein insertase
MFNTFFYDPLYNLLVLFLRATPHGDIGVSIILLTILVKVVLYPLYKSSTVTQHKMKKVEKEIKGLKEKHKADQKELALKTMEVYKRENIKPFSSIIALFIQIPLFIALYLIFSKGIHNNPAHLYSFITYPERVSNLAFGLFDVSKKFIAIGFFTAASYLLLAITQSKMMGKTEGDKDSFAYQFNDMLKKQMLYVFPIVTGVTAAAFPSAIGLYWITSNLLGALQAFLVNKHIISLK